MSVISNTKNYKGNILIIDDQLDNLQVLSKTLLEAGYNVRGAVKGEMALRAAKAVNLDLILLDIKMPDMSGYEICQILKRDRQTQNIPVVFLSALDEAIDKVKGFQAGGVDYITKPFQVEEVLARIEHQLTIRRLQQQLEQQNQTLQQEIQERKRAEETAAAASKAKSEFLANMSHELRTPLNSILGFTQVMLRDRLINPEQREYLGIINRSGEHLLDLIDDILDLSKIEAGIIKLNEKDLDLYALLHGLEDLFQIRAESRKNILQFDINSQVPQYVQTDEQKLRSCLINLLGNAIKFTEGGTVTVTVNLASRITSEEQTIQFQVADTGPGISPEEQANLFQAFVQTETGIKSAQGTGLGLSITQQFVQLMGGEISVSSEVGAGTVFFFYIPLKLGTESVLSVSDSPNVVSLQPGQESYRILIADDTPENRKLLTKLLETVGFQVAQATHGEEAIALWESWNPHLVFMDTRMPGIDGIEATCAIRERESAEGRDRTPIIALTASAFEERRAEILGAGSDSFLCKPFKSMMIFNTLSQYLSVTYVYEESEPFVQRNRQPPARSDEFWQEHFETMPISWVEGLYQAAREVNEEQVEALLESMPIANPTLLDALLPLFDNFRLDIIMRITEEHLERSM